MDPEHEVEPGDFARTLRKVRFPLSAEDARQGVEAEILWAGPIPESRFRIESIPFYVYGISYHDVVSAVEVDGLLRFRSVVSRGGHSTYRILLKDPQGYQSEDFVLAWKPLEVLGCRHEVAKQRWVAIDVPSATDVFTVYHLLEASADRGIWTFEEAHCGHVV